jgi:hypothetical protein
MQKMDRGDALDEARFAAMETVVSLLRAGDGCAGDGCAGEGSPEWLESLRQALASARATVVAAAFALTTATDATRMETSAGPRRP